MPVKMMDGFPIRPNLDYIFVADLGQPNKSHDGTIYLGDDPKTFSRYKYSDSRYGIVCAMGPGRLRYSKLLKKNIIDPALEGLGLSIGDVVIFSRRLGTRTAKKFQPPGIPCPLFLRVLDPSKVSAIIDDFEPWWEISEGVLHPDLIMSG